MFKTVLPIYQCVDSLDCANFSSDTIWQGSIKAGKSFNYFENKTGTQFHIRRHEFKGHRVQDLRFFTVFQLPRAYCEPAKGAQGMEEGFKG